jgi:hypothetical protein
VYLKRVLSSYLAITQSWVKSSTGLIAIAIIREKFVSFLFSVAGLSNSGSTFVVLLIDKAVDFSKYSRNLYPLLIGFIEANHNAQIATVRALIYFIL